MALPKRRHSSSRSAKRRAHHRLRLPTLSPCPQCGTMRPSHRVCPQCGSYRGKTVAVIEAKEKKSE